MVKRFVIVGGVAGGASTAARLRRIDEDASIIMFERDEYVSFSNCGLPYFLSGKIPQKENLLLMNPENFKNQYNIDARVNSEVISMNLGFRVNSEDRKNKNVTVQSKEKGTYKEEYDYLILSPGADAIIPNIPGLEAMPCFVVKNVNGTAKLNDYVRNPQNNVKNITVIGAGFIGLEVMENLKCAGFNVTLVEAQEDILPLVDKDMVPILHKELLDKGVKMVLGDTVNKISKGTVHLASGGEIPTDALVLAVGIKPAVDFAKKAGIKVSPIGAIITDSNGLTNDPHIYAVGDAAEVYSRILHQKIMLPLAGPAQKFARNVANHIYKRPVNNRGVIHSFCIQLFDYNVACTGTTEVLIQKHLPNLDYTVVKIIPQDKVGIMPHACPLHFKLIFEKPSGKVLGAQAIGRGDVTKRIDIIATVIKMDGTIFDLQDLELAYSPPFSTAKDSTNMAAYVGTNLLLNEFKQVDCSEVRGLVEAGAPIIDVREKNEFAHSHIKTAKNIPLSELRWRIDEFPKDVPVYVHCRSGQRSYNAVRVLQHHGIEAFNIASGFLGLCFYEYYKDRTLKRDPIVTDYNFN